MSSSSDARAGRSSAVRVRSANSSSARRASYRSGKERPVDAVGDAPLDPRPRPRHADPEQPRRDDGDRQAHVGPRRQPPLGEHRQHHRHRDARRHADDGQPALHQQVPGAAPHEHRDGHHAVPDDGVREREGHQRKREQGDRGQPLRHLAGGLDRRDRKCGSDSAATVPHARTRALRRISEDGARAACPIEGQDADADAHEDAPENAVGPPEGGPAGKDGLAGEVVRERLTEKRPPRAGGKNQKRAEPDEEPLQPGSALVEARAGGEHEEEEGEQPRGHHQQRHAVGHHEAGDDRGPARRLRS